MTERHSKSLKFALSVLQDDEHRDVIKEVYLFGSCARGEENYQSDIDLLVIADPKITKQQIRNLKNDVCPDDYLLPEVNLIVTDSFKDASSSNQFNKNVRRDGILLWRRS